MDTNIDLSEDIKKEISERVNALMELAQIHQVPIFLTIVTGNTSDGTNYNKKVITAQSLGLKLQNDTIRKHLLVETGYDLIPPRENITIDMGELMND